MKNLAIAALLGTINASFLSDLFDAPNMNDQIMTDDHYKFMQHLNDYGISFGTRDEYEFRLALFTENLREVEAINADPNMTSTATINKFSTWTKEERSKLLGFKHIQPALERKEVWLDDSNLADSVDWVTKGAVTPVKN